MAKAYRVRRQASDTDTPPLTPAARHARAVEMLTMLATATTVTKRRAPDGRLRPRPCSRRHA